MMRTGESKTRRVLLGTLLAGMLLAAVIGIPACGSEDSRDAPSADGGSASAPVDLAKRGRAVYQSNCTACHNNDPSLDGAVGPALAGSSVELLRAKVLRNEYPPGYQPKRSTGIMIALPHLEPELPALAAYLAEPAGS